MREYNKKEITIVLPVLNEEETLVEQVDAICTFLDRKNLQDYSIKVVICDNGSTDNTRHLIKNLAEKFNNVEGEYLDKKGVGLALKHSWRKSRSELVGYMDLDLATDINHLLDVIDLYNKKEFDVLTGSRLLKNSKVIGRSLKRGVVSRVFNLIVRILFKPSFTDGMCGFKFIKRDKLEDLIELGADNDGWFFATELLLCASHKKLKIIDLPVKWNDDPNSKVDILKLSREYLLGMFKLKLKLIRNNA